MLQLLEPTGEIYEGQFGTFTVDRDDRLEVVIYRGGLAIAAIALALGTAIALAGPLTPASLYLLDAAYATFAVGLGVSLWTIHIYLAPLHKALQAFWLVGVVGSVWVMIQGQEALVTQLYHSPLALALGGWIFVALTGIFFKEAFCFNRAETKFLTFLVPILLGGHWLGVLPLAAEQTGLALWAALMGIFATRKLIQPIPPDLGDKSVFEYLQKERQNIAS